MDHVDLAVRELLNPVYVKLSALDQQTARAWVDLERHQRLTAGTGGPVATASHRQQPDSPRTSGLTETDLRLLIRVMIGVIAGIDVTQGVGYILGAPATAPSLLLMQRFAPMPAWGSALLLAGLLLSWRPTRMVGFALGGLVTLVWGAFAAAVLLPSVGLPATGWGWAPYMGLGVAHLVGTWYASKSATVRGGRRTSGRRRRASRGEPTDEAQDGG